MIKILSEETSNKIAAGEVVERPASVLKELLENSIDSGANNIYVYLDNLNIRVEDDGVGMNKEDMLLSVKRFATSKISKVEDLLDVATFGFRGEALAAIASVSKLSIISKQANLEEGYKLYLESGNVISFDVYPTLDGTTIDVKDIFFNTPARLKFLKSYNTEYKYILDVFEKAALSNENIHFKFLKNNKVIYDLEKENLLDRFLKIIPKGNLKFNEINYKSEYLNFKGFISYPESSRNDKVFEYIFVNNRPIYSNIVNKAIMDGYSNFLYPNKFPVYILFIETKEVDINVHPRKSEVRFKDSNSVFNIIKSEINKSVSSIKEKTFDYGNKVFSNSEIKNDYKINFKNHKNGKNSYPSNFDIFQNHSNFNLNQNDEGIDAIQLFNRYIVTKSKDNIQIIDQHAASERVMFERINEELINNNFEYQNFLIPYTLDLNKSDFNLLEGNIDLIRSLGLDIEIFGDSSIKISSLPVILSDIDINKFLEEIISDLRNEQNLKMDSGLKNKLVATMACHSSVRFGDPLDMNKIKQIVKDLRNCKDPFFCPHGRPTTFEISEDSILKKFRRK